MDRSRVWSYGNLPSRARTDGQILRELQVDMSTNWTKETQTGAMKSTLTDMTALVDIHNTINDKRKSDEKQIAELETRT